ncbi:uncharacterized protein LOC124929811 [Impatiens glandulifera]|uniref:uncharacterized protein LOC124929811 n=1 Tax=Impatiens glandulifera TaxID=253017 RepID=UPI001FB1702E|nr:uncharacterized protein LOC124929811 [Impatiens glandulifera]
MAACGSLHPIFDNPLPESPTTPWNQNHHLTEIFRDLYFQEEDNKKPSKTSKSSTPPLPINSKHNPSTSRRYSFSNIYDHDETSTNLPAAKQDDHEDEEQRQTESNHRKESQRYRRSKSYGGSFPPPISCLGRSGKPGMCFKYFRNDGRFILKEVKIPNQEFLHVKREDGRLQLRLVHSESEDDDEDDDDDNDDHEPGVAPKVEDCCNNKNQEEEVVAEEMNKIK